MSTIFEAMMIICFGISWPLSIYKSYKSKTTKGKSLLFIIFILLGYSCGISSKIISGKITYVLFFYILNFIMVAVDIGLYFRNLKLQNNDAME